MKTIIVATDQNWLIGDRPNSMKSGRTPWQGKLPADMLYFQQHTYGKRVLFTRPTYLSIPERFQPLKDRVVGVLTSDPDFREPGTTTFNSLDKAIAWADVIAGGGELYRQAILYPGVDRILRTKVESSFEGNIYFPELFGPEWKLVGTSTFTSDERNKYDYTFEEYSWGIRSADDIEVTPYPRRIVDPRNARTRAYLLELLMLQRRRKCPFCAGGKTLLEDPIEAQNDLCWLKVSHTPVPNAEVHLVIAPMRHVISREELTDAERSAMDAMLYSYLHQHGLQVGGGHWTREGPTEITGATVCHLHENYYVNQIKDGNPKLITVNCGRWLGEPGWLNH